MREKNENFSFLKQYEHQGSYMNKIDFLIKKFRAIKQVTNVVLFTYTAECLLQYVKTEAKTCILLWPFYSSFGDNGRIYFTLWGLQSSPEKSPCGVLEIYDFAVNSFNNLS